MTTTTVQEAPAEADATREPVPPAAPNPPATPNRLARIVRGNAADPAWVRPTLFGLLAATAVLYLWGLGASGWANSFYSAATQAGSVSWKAFFFGSSDAANFITVDKAPASLWVTALSARIFGVNSWSILVPQALEGVASVGILYLAVRRWFSPAAGLIAGAVLALTPVAVLMFRFNNPDALLVLLLVAAAYAITRALETGRTAWLVLAFSLVGCGFLAKMLQTLLVVPAFGLVYLIAAPVTLRRRLVQLVGATVAMIAAAGWWVAIVELTPASMRPYIGGSQTNSVLELIFGYNGFGRLTGNESGSVGGAGGRTGQWGATGWNRMFNAEFGGQASWLLPAALILGAAVLLYRWRAPRTDRVRAAVVLWGGWLLVSAAVFSFQEGIIHPYYTVALAPAIGALVGIGATTLWHRRSDAIASSVLALTLAVTTVWSWSLLNRSPDWHPELRTFVLVGGLLAAGALLALPVIRGRVGRAAIACGALLIAFSGPAAYSLETASTAHAGAIPSAGPTVVGSFGGPGGFRGGFPGGANAGGRPGGFAGRVAGGFPNGGQAPAGGIRGAAGGLLSSSEPGAELVALLDAHAGSYTWVAAAVGSNSASGYQLATGDPVMALGGFNGTDPTPTLAQFKAYVAAGAVHYFIAGGDGFGGFGGFGGRGSASTSTSTEIKTWVSTTFTARTVSGVTVYDLTSPRSG
jgi:4-amino-4-deoxy-L-arabinose transferase-like glycosyltransferase